MFQDNFQGMPAAGQLTLDAEKSSFCAGCGARIIDRYYLMAVDREWHVECLKCSECSLRLDNELTCFTKDGEILCREDYFKRFSVKKCASCNQGISSKELVMRAREHVYHISCFACDRCKRILATGEYFGMRGMQIYCKADYEVVLREEAQTLKTALGSSSTKGRPRKRKISVPLEGVSALTVGFALSDAEGHFGPHNGENKPKRMRTSFKNHQLRAMKAYFAMNHNPDAKDLKQLSQKTGLSKRVLQVWFQNARAKYRRTVCNPQAQELSPETHDQASPVSAILEAGIV
ncbi:LIM/homeobox protein Lhx9-like isoform X3 [Acropora palmata]|uniref:LIM/homeobox protein Lhx9-like isoform X3 n=1 Tax=Acropora palmata TaxID=6131 RepID=UPI003DA14DD3